MRSWGLPCSREWRHQWVATSRGVSRGKPTLRVKCLRCGQRARWNPEEAGRLWAVAEVTTQPLDASQEVP